MEKPGIQEALRQEEEPDVWTLQPEARFGPLYPVYGGCLLWPRLPEEGLEGAQERVCRAPGFFVFPQNGPLRIAAAVDNLIINHRSKIPEDVSKADIGFLEQFGRYCKAAASRGEGEGWVCGEFKKLLRVIKMRAALTNYKSNQAMCMCIYQLA